jgi:hypothetical protein
MGFDEAELLRLTGVVGSQSDVETALEKLIADLRTGGPV